MSEPLENIRIGQILQQANLIFQPQIEVALFDQKRYLDSQTSELKLGEILALRGWIKQQTADFFAERWWQIQSQSERKKIGFYLYESGLLNKQQINWILQQQQKMQNISKFGELACEKGWVNPKTIEFFVNNLSEESKHLDISLQMPVLGVKEALSRYMEGNTDLRNARLDCVDFSYIVLKKADLEGAQMRQAYLKHCVLNNSNLAQANLEQANLVKASLIETNLTEANLIKANLTNANLTDAILQGADLRRANLTNTIWEKAIYDRHTKFDRHINPQELGMQLVDTISDSYMHSKQQVTSERIIQKHPYNKETLFLF